MIGQRRRDHDGRSIENTLRQVFGERQIVAQREVRPVLLPAPRGMTTIVSGVSAFSASGQAIDSSRTLSGLLAGEWQRREPQDGCKGNDRKAHDGSSWADCTLSRSGFRVQRSGFRGSRVRFNEPCTKPRTHER